MPPPHLWSLRARSLNPDGLIYSARPERSEGRSAVAHGGGAPCALQESRPSVARAEAVAHGGGAPCALQESRPSVARAEAP